MLDAESSAGSVKLNEASLMFESSRMMGSGARVQLRFDPNVKVRRGKQGMGGQGLFPGAIVALKGKNGGGGAFLATEILSVSVNCSRDKMRSLTTSIPLQASALGSSVGHLDQVRIRRYAIRHAYSMWTFHTRRRSTIPPSS